MGKTVFPGRFLNNFLALNVAAVLAGAVCGDHVSPISDTTILASAGAQCNHINHVSTQIPYAMTVAACCLAGYLAGGIAGNGWVALAAGLILEVAVLAFILRRRGQAAAKKLFSRMVVEGGRICKNQRCGRPFFKNFIKNSWKFRCLSTEKEIQ